MNLQYNLQPTSFVSNISCLNGLTVNGTLSTTGNLYTNLPIILSQSPLTYTFSLSDKGKLYGSIGSVVYIPNDNTTNFEIGTQIAIAQFSTTVLTISAEQNVIVRSTENRRNLRTQNSMAVIIKINPNDWFLFGDLL
jgi:hypothetical protein